MHNILFNQLEIYWVNLDPTIGCETQKKQPCVILQSNMVNENSKTLIIAPILPDHKKWPFVVNITPTKKNGLDKNKHINLKQLTVVDISRFSNRLGLLEREYLNPIKNALSLIFDIN